MRNELKTFGVVFEIANGSKHLNNREDDKIKITELEHGFATGLLLALGTASHLTVDKNIFVNILSECVAFWQNFLVQRLGYSNDELS